MAFFIEVPEEQINFHYSSFDFEPQFDNTFLVAICRVAVVPIKEFVRSVQMVYLVTRGNHIF